MRRPVHCIALTYCVLTRAATQVWMTQELLCRVCAVCTELSTGMLSPLHPWHIQGAVMLLLVCGSAVLQAKDSYAFVEERRNFLRSLPPRVLAKWR